MTIPRHSLRGVGNVIYRVKRSSIPEIYYYRRLFNYNEVKKNEKRFCLHEEPSAVSFAAFGAEHEDDSL